MGGAYDCDDLESLIRTINFDSENGEVRISDRFLFTKEPNSVVECFVSVFEPTMEKDQVCIQTEKSKFYIDYDNDAFTAEIEKVIDSGHGGKPRVTFLVKFAAKKLTSQLVAEFVIK